MSTSTRSEQTNRATSLELFVDRTARRGVTSALYDQLRSAILDGVVRPGERLPASRELAARLGLSRQTVTNVYERLLAEGFTAGRRGGGTYVAELGARSRRPVPDRPRLTRPLTPERPTFDQRPGAPDPNLFPVEDWRRHVSAAFRTAPRELRDPGGEPELRRALAGWLQRSRGLEADPDQIVVTAGAQAALDLVIRLLVRPGDAVAVEEPGYPPVRRLLSSIGADPTPVPVDTEGLRVDLLPPRPRLVYTTPSHQYPLGCVLTSVRRLALLEAVERSDGYVLEDDYDSEYRHSPRPLEPLHRLDRRDRVVYVGTFSKTLSPALRIGFAVVPPALVAPLLQLRGLADAQPAGPIQLALARFIEDGGFARHVRRSRRVYAARHALVTGFLEEAERAGRIAGFVRSAAGLHVTALLHEGTDEDAVLRRAAELDLAVGGLRSCYAGPARAGLLLGFGSVGTDRIDAALERVSGLFEVGRLGRLKATSPTIHLGRAHL